ncbi:MAG: hypothetical protein ACXWUP_10845 [Allosphingosinicella sp.]
MLPRAALLLRLLALLLAAGTMCLSGPACAQDGPPPALRLTLRPIAEAGAVNRVEVRLELESPGLAAGDTVLRMPLTIVGIPTAAYEAGGIEVRDAQGPLALTQQDEDPRPEGVYRRYISPRATAGDVVVRYTARPRVVGATTNNGPLFDMRAEAGGFQGAGISFLALPTREGPYRITLDWDLAAMPAGSTGIWSLGEGRVETVGPAEQVAFSFYSAGPIHRYPEQAGRFGIYWLAEPPFAIDALAERIARLYRTMSAFFGDEDSTYRVFIRQHPYRGQGGTALARSFMFGYHAPSRPGVDELQELLAHEMAHNWPSLEGEHGDTAWYSEGAAEYYSLVFAFRAGLLDRAGLLREINQRAYGYYTHPFRGLTNAEAAARFWSDPFVQQVPYGRGFLYLARTDAGIRAATAGRRSLDDVVRELRARQLSERPYGIPQWLELVAAEIGREPAERDYRRMVSGEAIPPGGAFAPCFAPVSEPQPVFDLGFARRSLNDDATVQELRADSNAARAGLREGDRILDHSDLKLVTPDPAARMTLRIRRGDGEQAISYVPRGAAVENYRFADQPTVPTDQCRF